MSEEKAALLATLATQLKTNVVVFKYLKKDNTERFALGTLDPRLFPETPPKTPSDKPAKVQPAGQFRYYDLEANGWRGFAETSIIEVIKVVDTTAHIAETQKEKSNIKTV